MKNSTQLESLVAAKCLHHWMCNFEKDSILDQMKNASLGFSYSWNDLIRKSKDSHNKKNGIWKISYTEVYDFYMNVLTFKDQILLLELTMNSYQDRIQADIIKGIEVYEIDPIIN